MTVKAKGRRRDKMRIIGKIGGKERGNRNQEVNEGKGWEVNEGRKRYMGKEGIRKKTHGY